jgi:peptide/nickel transport system permease protein
LGVPLLRRGLSFLITAWLATVAVFVVLDVLPGDPAQLMLGTEARPDTLAALRAELHLDRPPLERYLLFVGGFFTGDLGTSLTYARPAGELVAERMAVTLPLAFGALVLSTLIAVPLGVLAASAPGRGRDWAVSAFGRLGIAVPGFWLAILLVLLFSVKLGWFPAGGFPGWEAGAGPALRALILPVLALALPEAAILVRIARSSMLDALGEDYVRTARSKGVSRAAVLWRHVLPNAVVPVVTVLGLQFAFLVGGTVVVENVFRLPGLGRLLHQAIGQRDVVIVRDVAVILAMLVVTVSFAVDLLLARLDPRPKVSG